MGVCGAPAGKWVVLLLSLLPSSLALRRSSVDEQPDALYGTLSPMEVALDTTDPCRNSSRWTSSTNAFSALLYGKDVGALVDFRILASSLRAHGATSDIVALIPRGDGMLSYCEILVQDGVRVLAVDSLALPASMRSPQTVSSWEWVFDKLNAWRLTDYSKVVNLDTDMIFVGSASPERLFDDCTGELCMVVDVAERDGVRQLNAGLIALTPSLWRFADLWAAAARDRHRYGYPEQEFLSAYAADASNEVSLTVLDPAWNSCTAAFNRTFQLYHFCGPVKPRWDTLVLRDPAKLDKFAHQWRSQLFSVDRCMSRPSSSACSSLGGCHWCQHACRNCTGYCIDERLACSNRLFGGQPV